MKIQSEAALDRDLAVVAAAAKGERRATTTNGDSLPESERRFRDMIDALPAAIYTTDGKGKITHFNPACVELSGRTPELGTDHWCVTWKLYYPDGRPMPHDECPMAIALKEGRIVRGAEAIAERPDGTRIWFTPYPTPLFDESGKIIGGINMLVDITERKRTEESRRAQEERYRQTLALMPAAVYSCDVAGVITYFNERAAQLWGRAPKLGDTDERFCGSEQMILPDGTPLPHDECPMAIALREGKPFRDQEVNIRRPDGSIVTVLVNIDPIRNERGEVIGAINAFHDMSALKRAEQALRDRQSWLEGQREALIAAVNDAPLETSLGVLVRTAIDAMGEDARAGFYLTNDAGTALQHVVGMPEDYAKAVDGFTVGPDSLACGLATATGRPILTADVRDEPLWQPWLWMAEKFDYRACWSFPIHSTGPTFAGTMAIYWRQPRQATKREQEVAALLTRTAAIIIARHKESQVRKQAEQALRESEATRRFAMRAAATGSWTWDAASGTVTWSAETYELFGIDPNTSLLYESWRNALHPDDRERADAAAQAAMQRGENLHVEYRINHPTRGERWLISIGRIIDPLLRPGYMVGVSMDITERKQAEQATARLATIVESADDAIISKDLDGIITTWNRGAQRLFGYTPEEAVGRSVTMLIPADRQHEEAQILDRLRRGESVDHFETVRLRKDGGMLDVSLTISPVTDSAGRVVGIAKIARDITHRKRNEQALRTHKELLERELVQRRAELETSYQRLRIADRMASVGTLASGLAHDMANLLFPLEARVSALLTNRRVEPEVHSELTVITALLDHLRDLSRNLALFSRDPEREGIIGRTNISQWSSGVHKLLNASVGREIIVKWDCPEGLPEAAIAPHRLTQAVQNLIHNARDAVLAAKAKDARHVPHITIEARSTQPGFVRISVIDNGIGMDDETLRHCTEPFFTTRDRPNTPGGSGSGLGMSLAHQITLRAGGTMEIESKPGQGTTITLALPIVVA